MNNSSHKEIIRAFTELTTELKNHEFNPKVHIVNNEAYTALKNKMTTMEIKYQLVPQGNHRANNTERSIQ